MLIALSLIILLSLAVFIFVRQPKFGTTPSGERLARVKQSPYYKEGQFHNLSHTPDLTEGTTITSALWEFLFRRNPRAQPPGPLPSMKTDLSALPPAENVLVWFGHSSYFMQ